MPNKLSDVKTDGNILPSNVFPSAEFAKRRRRQEKQRRKNRFKHLTSSPKIKSPVERAVLLALTEYADNRYQRCWPSHKKIASDTKYSIKTVRRYLIRLEEKGLIKIERRTDKTGRITTNVYTLPYPEYETKDVSNSTENTIGSPTGGSGQPDQGGTGHSDQVIQNCETINTQTAFETLLPAKVALTDSSQERISPPSHAAARPAVIVIDCDEVVS